MMKTESLRALYVTELKDLYDGEKQILGALPKMAQNASDPQLRAAFEEHLQQTRAQVARLETIFQRLGQSPGGKKCTGIAGIISEGEELIKQKPDPDVLDAGLIGGAQKVEHYEIAGYGTVRTFARMLGDNEAANLLQQTLDEEGQTDKKLTQLAERGINREAARAA
jgi:ferritin-like metal-binding protein YciE